MTEPADHRGEGGTHEKSPYICPFCGSTFDFHRIRCGNCQSRPVVPFDDVDVYDQVHLMCGAEANINESPCGSQPGADSSVYERLQSMLSLSEQSATIE